jgi:general secretion pathway protein I
VSASPLRDPWRGERGFTLLEVLVALVIAVLALAVLAHAGLDGLRGAVLSGRYQEALARAQSHLAAIGETPVPGDRQGDEGDGFHWRVRIVPVATTTVPLAASGQLGMSSTQPISLMAVNIVISWGTPRRAVELDSERVVASAASAQP